MPDRDELLAAMTDEVAALVLRDNYEQATALGNARAQAHSLLPVHRRMLNQMEKSGQLNRELEALPTDKELAARHEAGDGLTAPEFAVLLAYVKITLEREVLADTLVDEPWTTDVLARYFPTPLRERFAARMAGHRLRREIIATVLVNEVVNRGGTSFVFRAMEESGASAADVIRAYVVVRDVYGLQRPVGRRPRRWTTRCRPRRRPWSTWRPGGCSTGRCAGWSATAARRSTWPARSPSWRPGVADAAAAAADRCWSASSASRWTTTSPRWPTWASRSDLAESVSRVVYGFGFFDILETAGRTGKDIDRGGEGLLRAVRAVPDRRAAVAHLPAAAQRPVADAGPDGAALRPVRGAGRAHRRGAAVHAGGRLARRTGSRSGSRSTRRRSPGPATRWAASRTPRPTWPRCRCCSARSAPWSRPPDRAEVRIPVPPGGIVDRMERLIELAIGGMTCATCAPPDRAASSTGSRASAPPSTTPPRRPACAIRPR